MCWLAGSEARRMESIHEDEIVHKCTGELLWLLHNPDLLVCWLVESGARQMRSIYEDENEVWHKYQDELLWFPHNLCWLAGSEARQMESICDMKTYTNVQMSCHDSCTSWQVGVLAAGVSWIKVRCEKSPSWKLNETDLYSKVIWFLQNHDELVCHLGESGI